MCHFKMFGGALTMGALALLSSCAPSSNSKIATTNKTAQSNSASSTNPTTSSKPATPQANASASEQQSASTSPSSATPDPTPAERRRVTLALAGDVLPQNLGNIFPDAGVRRVLRDADVAIVNLESPLSERGQPVPLKFRDGEARSRLINNEFLFRSDARAALDLKGVGIDAVTLANNHIMDYGPLALRDTLQMLKTNGIAAAGAGATVYEARRAALIERNSVQVALLSYIHDGNDMLPGTQGFAAKENKPGVFFVRGNSSGQPTQFSTEAVRRDIQNARQRGADIVVVAFHWGPERASRPAPFPRQMARRTIELGADTVMGHHPHTLQGVEFHQGKPIFYSLGNFVFRSFDPLTKRTGIAEITFETHPDGSPEVVRTLFHGAYIRRIRPFIEGEPRRARNAARRLIQLSRPFGTQAFLAESNENPVAVLTATSNSNDPKISDLVSVGRVVPGIVVAPPYATENNFFKTRFYPQGERAYLRYGTALKLRRAAQFLDENYGLKLKLWDGYRPVSVQRKMWEQVRDARYVANPNRGGSNHNRGAAVDVTLVNRQSEELPMPTGYDDFSRRAHANWSGATEAQKRNRWILRRAMTQAGFRPLSTEWWHFDDPNARNYSIGRGWPQE